MLTKEEQIAQRARKHKGEPLHNVHSFIDEQSLWVSYMSLNAKSASGVDGQSWAEYGKTDLEGKLKEMLRQFRQGNYRAPRIRRTYIAKEDGKQRPLGIPTIADKVLQSAVREVLEPIYEQELKDFSYGFRKGRSAHQGIDYLFKEVSFGKIRYILDADIQNYFGEIDHGHLRSFLDYRIKDGVIRKMLDKWLKAGIMEQGQVSYPNEGTPQGGIISPLLSNIYLHYVLDQWFSEQIQPLLKGHSIILRYADDFVLGFENLEDAKRVFEVLPKRFSKYKLRLHVEKTKLVDLQTKEKQAARSFDFLGFTHYLGKSRKGFQILKRKTSKKKFSKSIKTMGQWLKQNRHQATKDLIKQLNVKLRGYYNYYGITFNRRSLSNYYMIVQGLLHKWLNRRGGKRKNWAYHSKLFNEWCPVLRPKIYHTYV